MERTVSLMIFFIHQQRSKPARMPKSGPPMDNLTKLEITPTKVADSPFTRLINSMKKTIAVPSFSKDSPSTSILK